MRKTLTFSMLILAFLFAICTPSMAIIQKPIDATTTPSLNVVQQTTLSKFEQKIKTIKDNFAKPKADFKDSVQKWLWFAIVLGIIAVALALLGGGGILTKLSSLSWTAAVICLVIWLLKKIDLI